MAVRDIWESIVFNRRRILPAVIAVALAAVSWLGVQNLLLGGENDEATVEPEARQAPAAAVVAPPDEVPPPEMDATPVFPKLLVARRDIQSGVMLVSELVEWREWREEIDLDMVVVQDVQSLDSVLGSVTRTAYAAGVPIAWDGIISPGGPGFMGAVLKPDMRAVTVEVDRATTVANIIYPGDRVDVIMVAGNDGTGAAAQAIVRDARVLAVGSTILSLVRYGKVGLVEGAAAPIVQPSAGETFTLEVSPVDSERIALAASSGRLTLAMRSVAASSSKGPQAPPVRLSEVMVESKPPPPEPPTPPVRIIRGGAGEERVVVES